MTTPTLSLLDTNVVMLLLRGGPLGVYVRDTYGFDLTQARPLVSIVTHAELRALTTYNGWGEKNLEAVDVALRNMITVDINRPEILEAYVDIYVYSRRRTSGSSRKMHQNDLWIAATARATGATLYTADKDFDHLDGTMLKRVMIPQVPPFKTH